MNASFENEEDKFLEFIKPHDLHLKIDLSASAPIGYPHIIDVSSLAEEGISETNLIFLDLVDTVASVLYKWDPALRDMLDYPQKFSIGITKVTQAGSTTYAGSSAQSRYSSIPFSKILLTIKHR